MTLAAVPFWFLRHGETDYNAKGLSQGALDIALNSHGRAQAQRAGAMLAGRGISAIIASPMLRTRETAEIVNAHLNLDVGFEADLREVVFGGMEGKPLLPWFNGWLEGLYTPAGAERFDQVKLRVQGAMARILRPGPLLIIAHGGVFRAVRDLMELPKEGLTPNAVPLYCAPTESGWEVIPASQ